MLIQYNIFEDDADIINISHNFYGVIYKITNTVNDKIYIGKTKNTFVHYIERKFKYAYNITSPYLKHALLKYGICNFRVKIIDVAYDLSELNALERHYISYYNSTDINIGYNIAPGGEGGIGGPHFAGHKHTEKTKQKMRNSSRHFSANKGKVMSQEQKNKIRASLINRVFSATHKIHLSAALKNKPKSISHKHKISQSLIQYNKEK